ncbi:MAG: glycosyltransferase family 4 protein [Nanobdellota archaeon]
MNRISIAIDARFMLRPLRGIPLYVLRLCEHLPILNRNIQFVYFINKGFEHNDTPDNYLPRIKAIEKNNPNVIFVNRNNDAEIKWEQLYLPRLIKQHNVDLLHMPANRISFFPGVPTVVTVHDVMEYIYLTKKYREQLSKGKGIRTWAYVSRISAYTYLTYKFGIKTAQRIITVSSYSSDDIEKMLDISRNKIVSIHHGVSSEYQNIAIQPQELRQHVLLLGGDNYFKNPQLAINAWSKLDPGLRQKYPLKVIGFSGQDSSSLIQAIKQQRLENEVEVHRWISQEEMVKCFKDAVLFLFPSRYEGFGFPLLQAMACGTPVISTNTSSIPEVLGDVGYQIDPDDVNGMALKIQCLLTDKQEWQKQSELGYKRSLRFSWELSAQKHLNVYEELL